MKVEANKSKPVSVNHDCLSNKKFKVLCVDDDPDVANAMNRNFHRHGIDVVVGFHGMQGYWLACTEMPDVIVIDLCMPRGKGEEIIECLKGNTQTRHIPIVVLSGIRDTAIQKRVIDLGAECFMEKPTPFEELLSKVEDLVAAANNA